MDLLDVIELNHEPMLVIKKNKICAMNAAFQTLFPRMEKSKSVIDFIPDYILTENAEKFFCSALIRGLPYSVSALRMEDSLVLTLSPLSPGSLDKSPLSDGFMICMLSALGNVGFSLEQLMSLQEETLESDPRLDKNFRILNHNYHILRRHLENLHTALSLSRGTMAFLPQQTDLAKLCSDLIESVSLFLRDREISLEFHTPHGELFAHVDPHKVERILLNLLANSYKHTPVGGSIKLGLSLIGSNAIISMDDSGSGIPQEVMRNIFTRWEEKCSASSLTSVSPGLGLSIARGLAEEHGGTLIIESRENAGTSIRVLLPLNNSGSGVLTSPPLQAYRPEMSSILTQLSDILDNSFYGIEYMD